MNIVIRIGNTQDNIIKYVPKYFDDFSKELIDIEQLVSNKNITITNCDHYLLYSINNFIMRYIVSKNKDIPSELKDRFNLNPKDIKILEIDEFGKETCIQDKEGLIQDNYFDKLMEYIMDDFYKSLNYYH